jgi:hypothetical protein
LKSEWKNCIRVLVDFVKGMFTAHDLTVKNSPFSYVWTMDKDYCLMLLLLPRGLR